jgi:hypothetical protein
MDLIGDTQLNKEFSVRMADILGSKEIVEYRLAESFDAKNGRHTVSEFGGAATLGKSESLTGNVQIFVHPTRATDMAENVMNSVQGAGRWTGGSRFDFYDDVIDGHEFGHAHEGIGGGSVNSASSYNKAVRMENAVRERRSGTQRRVQEQ